MKKITADVLIPIYGVVVVVEDDATEYQIRQALFSQADYLQDGGSGWDPLVQNFSQENASPEDVEEYRTSGY